MSRSSREAPNPGSLSSRQRTSVAVTTSRIAAPPRPHAWPRTPRSRRTRASRLAGALVLLLLSTSLLLTGAGLDGFLNRGIVYGSPPIAGGGLTLGMNVFLEKEADRQNVVKSVQLLKDGGVTIVRQSFPWAEIEPEVPGDYRDVKTKQDTWAKYDFIVDQLTQAGIGVMARVDTIPRWARPPTDDFARWDKGPPQDFNNYANFVATVAARYKGRIGHFQVWNEPNLTGEWGGKPISPQQYGLLLKRTADRVKAVNPAALIVTAGLAQTTDDPVTNNMSELTFIQGLYDHGAQDSFDILSVMGYGLGNSPEDRRVGTDRYNFSRTLLVRDIMVRNGDAAKPVWLSEYGWIAVPEERKAIYSNYWGPSADEETQARWTVEGLERARREWPWVGTIFVWGFRWVEPPTERPNDPARYFEVVDHDFAPRPAYVALRDWSAAQRIAASGLLPVRDKRFVWQGQWRDQTLGGQTYRVTNTDGATVRIAFQGTDLRLLARAGGNEGRMYATIDGRAVAGLERDENGSYLLLRDGQTNAHDTTLPLASDLDDGQHLLELRYGGSGPVAMTGIAVGRRRPFDWPTGLLFAAGLIGVFAAILVALRSVLLALGWLPHASEANGQPRHRAWWNTRE